MPGAHVTEDAVAFCFIDWRPIGAAPIAEIDGCKFLDIQTAYVEQYVTDTKLAIPNIKALERASVLARVDGFFVVQIVLKRDGAFDSEYLDELSQAVCMVAKGPDVLGHRHDVHGAPTKGALRGGIWPLFAGEHKQELLRPEEVLVTVPILVDAGDWQEAFAKKHFDNDKLRQARAVPSPRDQWDNGGVGRHALICLRRQYLKVFENLQDHLIQIREGQLLWQSSRRSGFLTFFLALVIAIALYLAKFFAFDFDARASSETWQVITNAILFVAPLTFFFLVARRVYINFKRWELRRIRMLRSAVTFFSYANPINVVMRRLYPNTAHVAAAAPQVAAVPHVLEEDSFKDLITLLESKTQGEMHRASIGHLWMTLSLALAALILAAFPTNAIATTNGNDDGGRLPPDAIDEPQPPSDLSSTEYLWRVDCGWPNLSEVGPFEIGSPSRLTSDATSVQDLFEQEHLQPNRPNLIMVLGSADEIPVRNRENGRSNETLARARAELVAGDIRKILSASQSPEIEVISLNEGIPLVRTILGGAESISGRVAIVCGAWRQSTAVPE